MIRSGLVVGTYSGSPIAPATARREALSYVGVRRVVGERAIGTFNLTNKTMKMVITLLNCILEISNFRFIMFAWVEMLQSIVLMGQQSNGKTTLLNALSLIRCLPHSISEGLPAGY